MRIPPRHVIPAPESDDRRDRVEHAVFERLDARRAALAVPVSDERRDRIEHAVFERLDALRAALVVPAGDDRRDRVERAVFERLDGVRGADRAELVAPVRAPPRRWIPYAALAGVAAAAALALVVVGRGSSDPAPEASASSIVVPPGQTTRFTEGDAEIVAGGDTSVAVTRGPNAGVSLALARGSVECEVAPRGPRAPFEVVAGDVVVTVVGTHFTVRRDATGVVVAVAHGRVHVKSPAGEVFVGAGETWPRTITAAGEPPAVEPLTPAEEAWKPEPAEIEMDAASMRRPVTGSHRGTASATSQHAYRAAVKLEAIDRTAAARAYRELANGHDSWAPIALADLVRVERDRGRATAALAIIDEYLRRYPAGAAVEDMLWTRVEIARTPAAATAYLQRFPDGTYAKRARRIVAPP